jgi:eukaryotic-like serine/threonine-protein kinase
MKDKGRMGSGIIQTEMDIPQKIGRYQIEREIGRGGMGVVYLARDPFIGRRVAVKTGISPPPKDPAALKAFQYAFFNEAHAAGKLTHPNIVYVYDACVESERCYLVLEYVDGPTLTRFCRPDSLLPVERVINVVYQCAKALDYAHRHQVIHRDIKPSNIMLKAGNAAKITDFGIADVTGLKQGRITNAAAASLYYSSPEQLKKTEINHQTDLFSLGVILYELLTGIKPFTADTDVGLFFKITSEDPPSLKTHRPDLPEALERITKRAMKKDPANRYQSGRQLAWDLSAHFDHLHEIEEETAVEEKIHAIKQIPFFRDFSVQQLSEVVDVTQWVDYAAGASIISEGAIEDCFYIIVSGGVRVSKRERLITELEIGDCFGEMAYLGKTARTADVEASGDTTLMRVNPTVIDQTSKGTQLQFYKVFANILIERLARTSELLACSD